MNGAGYILLRDMSLPTIEKGMQSDEARIITTLIWCANGFKRYEDFSTICGSNT